ncbi:protein kinase domain-containing protein [Citrus sinensis]|nr:protein kinase domain-containing protein [Citrus sinensis]
MERIPLLISMMIKVLLIHCLILISLIITAVAVNTITITTDQDALLTLKPHIAHEPGNLLAKNWTSNTSVCNWMGVTCDVHSHRVTVLNISHLNLTGSIPSQLGNLSSLQALDLSFNRFNGTIPSSIFSLNSLQILDLSDNQLSGSFPSSIFNMSSLKVADFRKNRLSGEFPANIPNKLPGAMQKGIGNLTKLEKLYLGHNRLQGTVPSQLGSLSSLQYLDLSFNQLLGTIPSSIFSINTLEILDLSNNQLSGSFPFFNMSSLQVIDLSDNRLSGELPANIFSYLPFVQFLSLAFNQFAGHLPREIGNLTSLTSIDLSENHLMGEIPHEIGNLRNLQALGLLSNNLVGVVPATLFNISTLKILQLTNNTLSGSISSSIRLALPNLELFSLANNNFSGKIPSFIFNASKLSICELPDNSFSGFIPNRFHNMRNLKELNLEYNYITSSNHELSFISSLANSKKLKVLSLTGNPLLDCVLPSSIGNLSLSMERFYLHNCNIRGSIPKEMGNLINLIIIRLGYNKLNGSIPSTLSRLEKLQILGLENNQLEGRILDDICRLARLSSVYLDHNKLSGSIPACFGNLASLRKLSFASNELTFVPSTFWNLTNILMVDLSSNPLSGSLPLEIGNLKVLVELYLSRNNLSGDIPTTIGGLKNLQNLSLGDNNLQGSIPNSIGDLISLECLDLSNNILSGIIPSSLEKLLYLKYLNVSFNRLEGEIPRGGTLANFTSESFMGNDLLCGSPHLQVPPCKSTKTRTNQKSRKVVILLGVALPLSAAFIIISILAFKFGLISTCRKGDTKLSNIQANMPLVAWRRFSYQELLQATDQFNVNNLIGSGSFGSVYRGRFLDGMEVAIKVFHLQLEGALESFNAECEVLRSIRHRNLVRIISSCTNDDFKALVLDYMPKGSLEACLYSDNSNLDIFKRLNIVIDIALALEYLHFGHPNPVVHCDIKPSNVLLDEDMVARLGDFGIAKLLSGDESMKHTQTLATIGYMAPEYGREGQISTEGDVYSFGIMLMEIFTRKRPTDEIFSGEMSLKRWVNDSLPISIMNVVDQNLLSREDNHFVAKELCISSVFSLAVECTSESPDERINAKETLARLVKIRDTLLSKVEMVPA